VCCAKVSVSVLIVVGPVPVSGKCRVHNHSFDQLVQNDRCPGAGGTTPRASARSAPAARRATIGSKAGSTMMAEKSRTEIDTQLLQKLRRRAQEQGRPEGELLEEAVRRYLERPGSLSELFERIAQGQRERGVEPLSDEGAMKLAVEEQHAWRRERRERAG
jgi:nucleotide-binding universal stress UspA family protein